MLLDLQGFVITKHTAIAPNYSTLVMSNTTNWILANSKVSSLNNCLLWHCCLASVGFKIVLNDFEYSVGKKKKRNIRNTVLVYTMMMEMMSKIQMTLFHHIIVTVQKNPHEANFKTKKWIFDTRYQPQHNKVNFKVSRCRRSNKG